MFFIFPPLQVIGKKVSRISYAAFSTHEEWVAHQADRAEEEEKVELGAEPAVDDVDESAFWLPEGHLLSREEGAMCSVHMSMSGAFTHYVTVSRAVVQADGPECAWLRNLQEVSAQFLQYLFQFQFLGTWRQLSATTTATQPVGHETRHGNTILLNVTVHTI